MSYFSLRSHDVELELKIITWNILFFLYSDYNLNNVCLNLNVPFFFTQHLAVGSSSRMSTI